MAVPRQVHIFLSMYTTVIVAATAIHAQRDACGAELNTFLPAPFNSSMLLCKSVWNSFILRLTHLDGLELVSQMMERWLGQVPWLAGLIMKGEHTSSNTT
ncbi:hypothetical protein E2562_031188 [Oryza meyeriana var. granulata]|uniref:Uncharacterized protein n=1 Tax=Oryza meyeriana var. granulata TaxID=110450 RepID=A0A6G1ERK7_9ORYZ|nr:hypothetical protein E2562_031188 [Oryza meyeriana var. granulata]